MTMADKPPLDDDLEALRDASEIILRLADSTDPDDRVHQIATHLDHMADRLGQAEAERVGPTPGSEPDGSGFGKPWVPQPGVTFIAANAFVRALIGLEPGPPHGLVGMDIGGKWNRAAADTLSVIASPALAKEWGTLLLEAAYSAPLDAATYRRTHP